MGTVAEEWMKQGEARGEARGRAESVLRILQGRFGEIDDRIAAQIRSADVTVLDAMLDRALTAKRPEDVLEAFDTQP